MRSGRDPEGRAEVPGQSRLGEDVGPKVDERPLASLYLSGPLSAQATRLMAIPLSMIVVTTS